MGLTSRGRKKEFAENLLRWWQDSKRDFPWRRTKKPYKILAAEQLLRKTTAQQAAKCYPAFLKKYPSIKKLAEADEEDLKKLLKPLGMEHRRTKLFIELAKTTAEKHGGVLPSSLEDLLSLPGVGRYAASAVLCMAHGKDVPMVDTNAVRVLQRMFGRRTSRARARDDPQLWSFAESLMPPGRSRDLNLAVIDFAHSICTPRKPRCTACPLSMLCSSVEKSGQSFGAQLSSKA